MQTIRINGYDMALLDIGNGRPLICVHGSLCDFRVWSPVLGPLSRKHRVIAVSLRHCFPEAWDGDGDGYSLAQHVDDIAAYMATFDEPVDLMGHSRGGYVAFRAALADPAKVRRLILAEPGGELDASLLPPGAVVKPTPFGEMVRASAAEVAKGDTDGGLQIFVDTLEGQGVWARIPGAAKQSLRDNAMTLIGQAREHRIPFTRDEARALTMPTLLIAGERTKGPLIAILNTLAANLPNARVATIPRATHPMFEQNPSDYAREVLAFLSA